MLNTEKIYQTLINGGVDFFTGVPDSLLKAFCAYISDHAPRNRHVIAVNEGAAVGIAAGYHMATGKLPLVYMQNSGLGNAVNPLLSLADRKVYGLPMLLMVGWRGEPGVKDEPQHIKQGEVTLALLEAMRLPHIVLDEREGVAVEQLTSVIAGAKAASCPYAVVVRKNTFAGYRLAGAMKNGCPLSREAALKLVAEHLDDAAIVVSTTGRLSRELYDWREAVHRSHSHDFLTVGSMGHASSIALGLSLARPERKIFCFDGDGAFLMHMGAAAGIGDFAPGNYYHILFNNGAHESVGGQPTCAWHLDVPGIAKACGYRHAMTVQTADELKTAMAAIRCLEGPVMLEVKVCLHSREDLGRPARSPEENKEELMRILNQE